LTLTCRCLFDRYIHVPNDGVGKILDSYLKYLSLASGARLYILSHGFNIMKIKTRRYNCASKRILALSSLVYFIVKL